MVINYIAYESGANGRWEVRAVRVNVDAYTGLGWGLCGCFGGVLTGRVEVVALALASMLLTLMIAHAKPKSASAVLGN
jgi:hypothetical protein